MQNDIDTLVETVLAATTPASWHEAVHSFGPGVMRDPRLGDAVRERITLLRDGKRGADAETLDRWYDEVRRRIAEQQVMDEMLLAGSDAEIDALLRQHPSIATADSVQQAIAEVRKLLGRGSRFPPAVAAVMAGPILNVNLRIAAFIGADRLRAECLMERAMVGMVTDDPGAALRDFDTATELWRSVGDVREAGRCLSMSGNALLGLGRPDEAAARMLEAARLLQEVHDDAMLGPTYDDVAQILARRGDLDGALEYMELSVQHRIPAGQHKKATRLLAVVIAMRLQRHDLDRALTHAEQLADLCTDNRDALEPADVTELVGMIRGAAVAAAVDSQGEAEFLRRSAEAGAFAGAAPGYRAYVDPTKLAQARRWHAVAERIHLLAPGAEGEAVLKFVDALLSLSSGQPDRAVREAQPALRFFTDRRDHETTVGVLSLLIQAESARGNLTAALAWCDDLLSRLTGDGDEQRRSQATCLISRAHCLLNLGRLQQAMDDLNRAVRLSRADPNRLARTNEGAAQGGLARVYDLLGDVRAALEANREALRLARLLGHKRGEASQLLALGILIGKIATGWWRADLSPAEMQTLLQVAYQADPSLASRQPERGPAAFAVALLERAGRLSEEIHDEVGRTQAMLNLTNLLPKTEDRRKIAIITDLVRRKEAAGDRLGTAVALANLGAAHRALDQDAQAAQALEDSLAISRNSGYFESAAQAARDLAGLRRDQGDLRAAEAGFAEAVQMIEAARLQVPLGDRYRIGFVRAKERAYLSLVDLLVDREAYDDAFNLVQRAKSRALLEIAATAEVQPSVRRVGRVAELLADEAECLSRLRAVQPAAGAGAGSGDGSPTAIIARLNTIYDELSRFDPEYVSMRRGTPATVAELRAWLAAQGRPVLLVEYFLSGSYLTMFILRSEWTHVRVHRQPYTVEQMSAGYDDFRRQVVRYRNAAGAGWATLAQAVTAPLAQYLRPDDLVYLVPHRLLHGVPIHALPVDSQPLVIDHPIAYAPTSGLLPLAQNLAKGTGRLDSCVSFGVVFEEEAREVAALFGAEPIGSAALTAEVVEDLCVGKDVCHFSCHGYYNADYPLASGLILQPDRDRSAPVDSGRLLTARQVMDMRLRAELICVSACESGSSKIAEGDELLGLIRAFLHAGAPSVVASLWAVDAATTRDLMVAFYRQLRAQYLASRTIDKAGALHQAQLQIMDSVGMRSSFYWAPFVLIGDWR
jgi:CHAT domain-containing protein/tetratricopeptide (TPR) repeat protein